MANAPQPAHTLTAPADASPAPADWAGREWLLTGAEGSYAMGTALGANTRRYHGLLVAANRPPVDRVLALAQTIDTIQLGDGPAVALSAAVFHADHGRSLYHPAGHEQLRRFTRDSTVAWVYQFAHDTGLLRLTRRLTLHRHHPAITLTYTLVWADGADGSARPLPPATLTVRPLIALRDFHHLAHQHQGLHLHHAGQTATVRHDDEHALTLHFPDGTLVEQPDWWYDFFYPLDARRGQDATEDLYTPGPITFKLAPSRTSVQLTAALGDQAVDPRDDAQDRERTLAAIASRLPVADHLKRPLALATDDFVVTPQDPTHQPSLRTTILAGYPWFADWGRDTFIALPGLLLCTGRLAEARAVLRSYADAMRDGLVPNRFDDRDPAAAQYNTVDASLWYVRAAVAYLEASPPESTDSREAWDGWLAEACLAVAARYARGGDGEPGPIAESLKSEGGRRRPRTDAPQMAEPSGGGGGGIYMDPDDGMIVAGDASTNLTWMDAEVDGKPVTPRFGKAVEINALWHHALTVLAERLPERHRAAAEACGKLAKRVGEHFERVFWDEQAGRLCDHVVPVGHRDHPAGPNADQPHHDPTLRPNMAIAAALPGTPISDAHRRAVVKVLRNKLLTPMGLRTLAEDDPDYHGSYAGPQAQRDGAYHRGTVWPWLIGPYAEAELRAGGFSDEAKARVREALTPLVARLGGGGKAEGGSLKAEGSDASGQGAIGQLPEICQGSDLSPRGCPAQAWSVGEVVRVLSLMGDG